MTKNPNKTRMQDRFIIEYLKDKNGTQAAIRAGYSPKTANEQASHLLAKVNVKRAVNRAIEAQSKRMLRSADDVLRELERVGFVDIRNIFDADGSMKSIKDIPEDEARAIAGLDIDELYAGRDEEGRRSAIGITKKIKLYNKVDALKALAQHHKLLSGENDTSVQAVTEMLTKLGKLLK